MFKLTFMQTLAVDGDARFVELAWRLLSQSSSTRHASLRPALVNVLALIVVNAAKQHMGVETTIVESWTLDNYLYLFEQAFMYFNQTIEQVHDDYDDELLEQVARGEIVCWPMQFAVDLLDTFVSSKMLENVSAAMTGEQHRFRVYRLLLVKFNSGEVDATRLGGEFISLTSYLIDSLVHEANQLLEKRFK
jgi:hypothetical protein